MRDIWKNKGRGKKTLKKLTEVSESLWKLEETGKVKRKRYENTVKKRVKKRFVKRKAHRKKRRSGTDVKARKRKEILKGMGRSGGEIPKEKRESNNL